MRSFIRFAPLYLVIVAAGCVTNFSSSGRTFPPRSPNCAFEMFSVPPMSGFDEVGTIVIEGEQPFNMSELKVRIAEQVCKAGGDAVFSRPNGYGAYVNATVLKRIEGSNAPGLSGSGADSGCQNDAQCKGDRLCVKHECVDPSK